MKLQDMASVAEIVSSVAVLVTLIFLVIEVGDNTASIRASTYQDLVNERSQRYHLLASDDRTAIAFAKMIEQGLPPNSEEFDEATQARISLAGLLTWLNIENSYFQYLHGTLSEEDWLYFEQRMCRSLQFTDADDQTRQAHDQILSKQFLEFRSRTCIQ